MTPALEAAMRRLALLDADLLGAEHDAPTIHLHPTAVAHIVAADDGRLFVWLRPRATVEALVAATHDVCDRIERLRRHGGPPPGEPWERSSGDFGWFLFVAEHDLPGDLITLPRGAARGSG